MKNVIKNIAQDIADENGLLLINSITKGSNKHPDFEIYIDSKNGISVGDCAKFSREIKERIESTFLADLDYKLVVSSPGTDEAIIFIEQYYKHINREFKLSYSDGDKVKSIEAQLLRIADNDLVFNYKNEDIIVNFNNIKKAKVKISF